MSLESNLNNILNVNEANSNVEIILPAQPTEITLREEKDDTEVKEDFDYARKNIKELIETGMENFDRLSSLAEQSQSVRAYEATSTLIRTLSDANKVLLELSSQKKSLMIEDRPKEVTNNNLFLGSTKELLELVKKTQNA
jgi:hypothetical protein